MLIDGRVVVCEMLVHGRTTFGFDLGSWERLSVRTSEDMRIVCTILAEGVGCERDSKGMVDLGFLVLIL